MGRCGSVALAASVAAGMPYSAAEPRSVGKRDHREDHCMIPTIYEAAGGRQAFIALAHAWQARCLADPPSTPNRWATKLESFVCILEMANMSRWTNERRFASPRQSRTRRYEGTHQRNGERGYLVHDGILGWSDRRVPAQTGAATVRCRTKRACAAVKIQRGGSSWSNRIS